MSLNEIEINRNFESFFESIYKEIGEFPKEVSKKQEDYERYWNDYCNKTKDYVSSIFSKLNRGNVFCLNFIGQRQNDGNKNIKIMKLDDDKYYIISNMFKLASKFNSKSSLDIDEVNELISIDIMFILNIKEFEKKWKVNVTIL